MGPGASAGLQWGSASVVGPPPLAIVAAVGLLSIALFVALFVFDRLAARERREQDARLAAARAADLAAQRARPGPTAAVPEARFPDLPAPELGQLALARLKRFVEVVDGGELAAEGDRQRLARWAVFSAYRDCAALGLEPEAREVLRARPRPARARAGDLSPTA